MLAQAAYPLVVCLIMAATIDELFLHEHVITPVNLSAFLLWATTATEEDLDKAFDVIYMVEHRMDEAIFGDTPVAPVVIERDDLDRIFTIPRRPCYTVPCQRCRTGRGGYRFRWVGPWTCRNSIGDEETPPFQVMQRYMACGCDLHR